MNYKDQLVLTGKLSDVGYPLMTNVKKSYRSGIEISSILKPVKWIKWEVNATLSQNEIKDFIEYLDQYDNSNDWNPLPQQKNPLGNTPISFSPSLVGSSSFTLNILKNLNLSLISKFVGKQYIDNTGNKNRMLDSYLVSNLKFDYQLIIKGLESSSIEFYVNNVFDLMYEANAWVYRARFANDGSEYREDGFFPQAGRNFMLKIGLDF
jgi:iron complex outermembrane receptor protein